MSVRRIICGAVAGALGVSLFAVAPAIGAASERFFVRNSASTAAPRSIGGFTPAAADPRLAASLARSGLLSGGFRFTPVNSSDGRSRALTVAVRARTAAHEVAADRLTPAISTSVGIAPVAYNLGVGVGWKRFALAGDVQRVDIGALPGSREGVNVGVSYNASKWSTRVQVAADHPLGSLPRSINGGSSMSVDVGGSYRVARNVDVTAGVRYKSERDRLETVTDTRRDSQAVYVGTAFRF